MMQTRLNRVCDAFIEAGWLAALVVTPLFFNTISSRVFEPDKIHLLRSIALLVAVAWAVQLLGGRRIGAAGLWSSIRQTPLVLPTLVLVGSYLLSTALSIVPRISLLGSYVRMQGTLTFLSYVLLFAAVLTHLRRRDQLQRILHAIILTSLPVALYGIIQHIGLDPLPWAGDVRTRVAANMGNAIFVAAYLIMAFFVTLERLVASVAAMSSEKGDRTDAVRTGGYLFVALVQLVAIVFTQSRGPWLGLAAGLYLFLVLGSLLIRRPGRASLPDMGASTAVGNRRPRTWYGAIGVTVAVVGLVIALNVPNGPFSALCSRPYLGRLCTLANTTDGTNAVRVLIWEGVTDMMLAPHPAIQRPDGAPDSLNAIRPLVGYGPESMWVAYNRFYPAKLAQYESRNASPDRSHDETFDALVRGGLIQVGAQLALFGSIFFIALQWLGLAGTVARRRLFGALLIAGGSLGVILPLLLDGSLRLAGVALPVGIVAGMLVYVTIAAAARDRDDLQSARSGPELLLMLGLLSAIVAHFVEVHFGIAVVSTLTHFWILAGVLVVVGQGLIAEDEAETAVVASAASKTVLAAQRPSTAARATRAQAKGAADRRDRERAPRSPAAAAAVRGSPLAPWRTFLPYLGLVSLLTLVLTWNYLSNQTGASGALAILWSSFTARVDGSAFRVATSPMLLLLLSLTWTVGGLLVAPQARARRLRPVTVLGASIGLPLAVWLVFGLLFAARLGSEGGSGLEVFQRMVAHVVVFDVALLLALIGLTAALAAADPRPRPASAFGTAPLLPLVIGPILVVLAFFAIARFNIQTVQADTYYKQGLGYESAGKWEGAAILYRESARLQPNEDFYYLFLGRSILQFSGQGSAGNPILPTEAPDASPAETLAMVETGLRSGTSADLVRAAQVALAGAQHLNPYNTDHTANLARLQRVWAFAANPGAAAADMRGLRAIVDTQPETVDMQRLDLAIGYYRQATALSPQNAVLWNETAVAQYLRGDLAGALASVERSLELDPTYNQSTLLYADFLAAAGRDAEALAAYRRAGDAAPRDPGVQGALGVFAAEQGDPEGALSAFGRISASELAAAERDRAQLNALDNIAAAAGGYATLMPNAASRRDALQASIAGHRAQAHLALRNGALVLREAGRLSEALAKAEEALALASDDERAALEGLIADLKGQLGQ